MMVSKLTNLNFSDNQKGCEFKPQKSDAWTIDNCAHDQK